MKMKEDDEKIQVYLCPHLSKLLDQEKSGEITKEQEEQELSKLNPQIADSPFGLKMMICEECFSEFEKMNQPDIHWKDPNGKGHKMKGYRIN